MTDGCLGMPQQFPKFTFGDRTNLKYPNLETPGWSISGKCAD